MSINKTEAIVLGSTNLVESHRIICLYSPDYAQIKGVAHGIKRQKNPFGSALEPLTHIHLVYRTKPNRELQLLQQADIIESFDGLRRDMVYLTSGLYIAELVQRLTPVLGNPQPPLFRLILKSIGLLAARSDIFSIMHIFEIRLLHVLGYMPQLEHCMDCASIPEGYGWGFSPSMGGVVCPQCRKRLKDAIALSPGGIMFLRQALQMDLEKIGRLRLLPSCRKEMESILNPLLYMHLNSPLKSYPILKRLMDIEKRL